MTGEPKRVVTLDRTAYARSEGDTAWARIDEPLAIDLGLPTSYAKRLLALLKSATQGGDFDLAEIAVDLPVRIYLRPVQVEQLIIKLLECG